MTEIITDNPDDLYGNDPEAFGGYSGSRSKSKFVKLPYYTIVNLDTKRESKHGIENEGKLTYKKINSDEREYFDDFIATLYFTAPYRVLKNKKGDILCSSCNGLTPDKRHTPPRCEEATPVQIAATLKRMNFKESSIQEISADLAPNGVLTQCGYRGADSIFPLCPSADTRLKSHCRLGIQLYGYDHDRGQDFQIQLFGMNASNDKRYVSPINEFEGFCRKNRIPMFGWQVRVNTAKSPHGSYVFNVDLKETPPVKITDVAQIKTMREKFESSKKGFMERHLWVQTKKAPPTESVEEENRDEEEEE